MSIGVPDATSAETFNASRWTRGNFWFPTRIEVGPERVLRIKPKFFGRTEESIPISKVASVQISTGIFWSDIRIDSAGGANPITSHGHRKADAERIRQMVEHFQQSGSRSNS
ncbi:MAG: PH domain-containing protein [Acidobacteriia bacterium]|nr:PH domain-containing protein [Terriglobia bacterium]